MRKMRFSWAKSSWEILMRIGKFSRECHFLMRISWDSHIFSWESREILMRIQKLLRIFERVDPFSLIFLDKDLCGQISADGILYDSNFSATYLESVSSSGSYETGKVPKTKAKPEHILTDVCLSRPSSSDSHYMPGEEEMRQIMLILEPTDFGESSSESEHDDGDDDDDQEATRRLVVRTSGQLGHGLRPRASLFVLQTRGKLACTLYILWHIY